MFFRMAATRMNRMIAYCGSDCDACPIYLATPDAWGIESVAAAITDCDGCRAGERLFAECEECEIRTCAVASGLDGCAACDEYPCDFLRPHLACDPDARARLEQIRVG